MTNDKIKFTFILPCYNGEDSIEQCLKSICAQSYQSIEIIVIDDGSTDLSLKLCEQFAQEEKRIRLFRQKNKGVSSARNLGLKHAEGEYIIFVDVDDYVSSDFCEIAYYFINESHTSSSDFWIFNHDEVEDSSDTNIFHERRLESNQLYKEIKYFIWDRQEQVALQYMALDAKRTWDVDCSFSAVWSKVFRKAYLEKNHIVFNDKVIRGEDTLFLLQCLMTMQQISYIPIKVYGYKRSPQSVSNSYTVNRVKEDQMFLHEFSELLNAYNLSKELEILYYYATLNGFKYCLDENVLRKSNHGSIKEKRETIKGLLNTEPYREAFSKFNKIDKNRFRTYSYFILLFCKKHQFIFVFLLHAIKQKKKQITLKK